MLTPTTINFILLAFGVIMGAYVPLALIYLVSFFRRERFGFILIRKVAARLVIIALLFFLICSAINFTGEPMGLNWNELDREPAEFLGYGFMGGFFVGIILFIIGLIRGRSRVVTDSVP